LFFDRENSNLVLRTYLAFAYGAYLRYVTCLTDNSNCIDGIFVIVLLLGWFVWSFARVAAAPRR